MYKTDNILSDTDSISVQCFEKELDNEQKLNREMSKDGNEKSKNRLCKKLLLLLWNSSRVQRIIVQSIFALLCIWIGIEFYYFVRWGQSGGTEPYVNRPPGVEGFLPISSLMSLKYWIQTGVINEIHPAGLIIFVAIIVIAVLFKKAFCGWLCPIGSLSEALWMVGKKIFGKNITLSKWLDYPFRSLKYLLLFYFLYAIMNMDIRSLELFIYSPYNKVADVKMYLFFANITDFALWTILILSFLSIFIKYVWCRYLCPYGALLGILSLISPLKITRDKLSCTDCKLCTESCPANIKVHSAKRVWNDECMSCYKCVEACPVKDTLQMRTNIKKLRVSSRMFAFLVTTIFILITGLAMLLGYWENKISKEEYLKRIQNINAPIYQHFRGQVPPYGPND